MARVEVRIVACLTLITALSGCTVTDTSRFVDGQMTTTPAQGSVQKEIVYQSYHLELYGVPEQVAISAPFSFEMVVTGPKATTGHLGAHLFAFDASSPSAMLGEATPCGHQPAGAVVPGTFTPSCAINKAGTFYLRGHLQLKEADGSVHDHWSRSFAITVGGAGYFLNWVWDNPEEVPVGETQTWDLYIAGGPAGNSGHIGAHYWTNPTDDPTKDRPLSKACEHVAGAIPAQHKVKCMWPTTGTYFLRGHMMTNEGKEYWTSSFPIKVIGSAGYTLSLEEPIATVADAGTKVGFVVKVDGPESESMHLGAHYWTTPPEDPTTGLASGASACDHLMSAKLPGLFEFTCQWEKPGTYYLHGHMRDTTGKDHWAPRVEVVVKAHYSLALGGPVSVKVQPGESITFGLTMSGGPPDQSSHIGAHYWTTETKDPTADFGSAAGACGHTSGSVPNAYQITCKWSAAGTYYLFGHMRTGDGTNFWSEPVTAVVGSAYTLSYEQTPEETTSVNMPIYLIIRIDGAEGQSGHMGAHYWKSSTPDPTASFSSGAACDHQGGAVPGTIEVRCLWTQAGTFYVRGHVRMPNPDGTTTDFWAPETKVTVTPTYTLTYPNALPPDAVVNDPVSFTLQIDGEQGMSSHIGAHHWSYDVMDPSAEFTAQSGACGHAGGGVPGLFTVTCQWMAPGTYYVHGHLRIQVGEDLKDYWGPVMRVDVAG